MAAAPPLPDIFTEDVTFPQTPSFQQEETYFETQTCEDRSPASHVQRDLTFTTVERETGRGGAAGMWAVRNTHTHTPQVFLPFVASSASAFFGLF